MLGFLSPTIKRLLIDVSLFMEVEEQNRKKQKPAMWSDKQMSRILSNPSRLAKLGMQFCPNVLD